MRINYAYVLFVVSKYFAENALHFRRYTEQERNRGEENGIGKGKWMESGEQPHFHYTLSQYKLHKNQAFLAIVSFLL